MRRFIAVIATGAAACAPLESPSPTPPASDTPEAYFRAKVLPELERGCTRGACHGMAIDAYRARGPGWFTLATDPDGRIASDEAVRIAYAEASGRAEIPRDPEEPLATWEAKVEGAEARIAPGHTPELSLLVRKVIPVGQGGLPHSGGVVYASMDAPPLVAIAEWIARERPREHPPLTALQDLFARSALPAMARKGCLVSSCHGTHVANPFQIEAGVRGELTDAMIAHDYKVAKKFVNLNARAPDATRLIAKVLRPEAGGIAHRGGNGVPPADPLIAQVRSWVQAELDAAGIDRAPKGVVYVRRPPAGRAHFDVGAWMPGADLWMLSPAAADGARTNLTAQHHQGPADVRTPEVSPDGTTLLFAMRKGPSDCLNVYAMKLDGTGLTQLTKDAGCREASSGPTWANPANLSPRYAPDGRIYFVSTRGGRIADKDSLPLAKIWSMKPDGSDQKQVTFSLSHEIDPVLMPFKGSPVLAFTSLRDTGVGKHGALYFAPIDWWFDYHVLFGEQSKYALFAQARPTVEGRVLTTLAPLDGLVQGGTLAIFDRNLGPDLEKSEDAAKVAYPAFVRALSPLASDAAALGGRGLLWRDPQPLGDGRIAVSRSATVADARSPQTVDFGLYTVRLGTTAGRAPEIVETAPLVHDAGFWEVEAAVVNVRKLPARAPSYLRPATRAMPSGTGVVQFYDALMLESILRDNRPTGRSDKLLPDLAGLSVVVGAPITPEDAARIDPMRVRNGDPASTRVSNGIHGRRSMIGPLPVEADHSIYFRVAAEQPFYLQTTDTAGMAAGMHFDRWLFVSDGEPLGNGVTKPTFDMLCGGCHGSYSGAPMEAVASVDILTSASVTLATHDALGERKAPVDASALESPSFEKELGPMLEARCATSGCHAAASHAGGLDLSATGGGTYRGPWSNGYESLMKLGQGSGSAAAGRWQKEYVDERGARARASYLMEKLLDRELEAPRTLTRNGCGAASALDAREKGLVARWIDLGATYLGAPGGAAPR